MTGTNAYAAPAGLLTLLQGEQGSGEGLENVLISFSYNGKLDTAGREYIWLGDVSGPIDLMTMGGTTGSRDEKLTLAVHIKVMKHGEAEAAVAVARAVALGQVVEAVVIANPRLGVSGVLNTRLADLNIEHGVADTGSWAVLTYQIEIESCLTGA